MIALGAACQTAKVTDRVDGLFDAQEFRRSSTNVR